jgi:hypothetical protein
MQFLESFVRYVFEKNENASKKIDIENEGRTSSRCKK